MAPGDAGQLIGGVWQAVVAVGFYHLMQRGDHPKKRPVGADPGARTDHPLMQPAGAITLDAVAALGRLAGESAPLQFGHLKAAQQVELIMSPTAQRHGGKAKGVDPSRVGGDVA